MCNESSSKKKEQTVANDSLWHTPDEHPPEGVWVLTVSKEDGYVVADVTQYSEKLGWGDELNGYWEGGPDAKVEFEFWCFLPQSFAEYMVEGEEPNIDLSQVFVQIPTKYGRPN